MRLPFGLRWWELVPEAVLGLGLALFLATEPDAATSAFESTTALVLMAATAAIWITLRLGSSRLGRRWAPLRTVAFGAAAAGVLALVVLPAYDDTTVVETLPVVAAPPASPTTVAPPAGPDEATSTTATVAPAPHVIAEAPIHGIDHRAEGTARTYRQPSGALVVGLEAIDIQPGPDYDVYVVPGVDREDIDGGTRLDDLRGNKGTQYYDVPPGIDLTPGSWTVLVWCQTFDVPVAGSTPR
ncbi:MAG: DM13 domain-containing protein [Actinomycetota bacterium]|nr:DM13 domain-containing protein [Actinomycetota bacterium]